MYKNKEDANERPGRKKLARPLRNVCWAVSAIQANKPKVSFSEGGTRTNGRLSSKSAPPDVSLIQVI